MRKVPLAAVILLASAGTLASASQLQRGSVSSVTVAPGQNDAAVVLTVRGSNPCRAVSIDYGDGTADTHTVGTLPATFNHEYARTGSYRVVVRGVTNCAGVASATVRASVATTGGFQGGTRFPGMDRNGDGRITRQEWRGSDQSFRIHDWNGDDVLAGDEVRTGARRRNQQDFGDELLIDWTAREFNAMDRDGNNRLTAAEWVHDWDTFNRIDRNSDNVVTRQEFLAGDDNTGTSRFEALDTNNNGRIERLEWRGTRTAFDVLDRNNDGVLTRAEFGNDDVGGDRDRFDQMDANGDGAITRNEWSGSVFTFQSRDANRDGRITRAEFGGSAAGDVFGNSVTLRIPGNQRWTDTGIVVRAGDLVSFDASGTIYMTTGTDDAAGPQGSHTGRYAVGAAMPRQPAGALVARVENAPAFFVGDRGDSIRMPRDGRLYLGVNDDYFGDNRGEFRVTITTSR